jgi:hypothetical protein
MGVDQLWYTWATIGFGVGRGWQVRAASERLRDRSDRGSMLARRFCYRPESAHVFGWADVEGFRIVFNKADAGLDGVGRDGNYFVHVLVGTPQALPIDIVAALFQSPFWVTQDPGGDDTGLPLVDVRQLVPGRALPRVEEATAERFIAFAVAALSENRRLAVPVEAPEGVALAATAASALPGSLGTLSFSTGEGDQTARNFDIVLGSRVPSGFRGFAADADPSPDHRGAAFALRNHTEDSRCLINAAEYGAGDVRKFLGRLITMVSFRDGRAANPATALALVSESPGALRALLDGPGIRAFVQQVGRGDPAAAGLLAMLDDSAATKVAKRLAATATDPARFVLLLERIARTASGFVHAAAKEYVDRVMAADRPDRLPVVLRPRLLRLMNARRQPSKAIDWLLTSHVAVAEAILTDTTINPQWRAVAAVAHESELSNVVVAQSLLADIRFAEAFLAIPHPHAADHVVRAAAMCPAEEAVAWLRRLRLSTPGGLDELAPVRWRAIQRLTGSARLAAVLDEARSFSRLSEEYAPLVVEAFLQHVASYAADDEPSAMTDRAVLRVLKKCGTLDERSAAWAALLERTAVLHEPGRFRDRFPELFSAALDAARRTTERDRAAAALLILDGAARSATSWEEFAWAAEALAALDPSMKGPSGIRHAMRACIRHHPRAPRLGVRYVLELHAEGLIKLPDERSLHGEALYQAASLIDDYERARLEQVVAEFKRGDRRVAERLLRATKPKTPVSGRRR